MSRLAWTDPAPLEVERPRRGGRCFPASWVPAGVLAGLAVAGGLWARAHPDSLNRTVARQVLSEWRRTLMYAWPWKRVMLFSDLTKHTGHDRRRTHYPTLRRVRAH